MGELNHYHITMLVDSEKENAIRSLFIDKDWPCLLKVVNDDIVIDIIESGYTDIFIVQTAGDDVVFKDSKEDKLEGIIVETKETHVEDLNVKSNSKESEPLSNNNDNLWKVKAQITDSEIKPQLTDTEYTDSDHSNDLEHSFEKSSKKCRNTSKKKTNTTKLALSSSKQNEKRTRDKECQQSQSSYKSEASVSQELKKTKFQCSMCGVYLATKASLHRHCQCRHGEEWFEFKCNDCPCMFKKVEELWKHRNDVKHNPPKVNPKFSEKKNLSPEELEQLGHLKCNACSKILPSRRLLRRHYYADHRECMPGPLCAVCGTEFKTRQELWKHKREMKHNDSLSLLQTYQCEECGKVLTGGFSSFKLHQKFACKEVEEGPQVPCDICGSLFKSKTHVQQHKKRTHINVPVVCDICGTVCKNKHSLNSHKRRHDSKNKKHVCNNCGKAFITNLLLIMHMRTHTKEKPFKCPLCDHRCAIKQNIQKHSLNVHKRQIKCADIITVSGTELQDYNPAKQHEEEFKATNGVVDITKMHTHGKSLHRKDCRQNDKIIDFQNDSNNFSPEMYKNNTDKGYQFNTMDVAYDLSLCKQNQEVSAGNEIQPVSVDFHPGSNVAVTISPATNYTELTTCKLNPFSYSQTNMDSPQFQTSWGNTENR